MGLIDALKAGNYQFFNNSTANITIKTGEGNNNINVTGGNINIATGNGNQFINAFTTNNLSITTGLTGQDYINANAFKGIINTGGSDDTIKFTGTSFDIDALDGNKTVLVNGNVNDTQSQNSITLGNGALNQIRSTANNVDITNGNGDLQLGFIGNNVDVNAGNGNHSIGFWGNNIDMNLGNGNNSIQTLDFSLLNNNFNDFGAADVLASQLKLSGKDVISTQVINSNVNSSDVKAAIAAKYNLSPQEIATLNSLDLSKTLAADGGPLYVIGRSIVKSTPGNPVYVVCQRDSVGHTWSVTNHECIASDTGAWNKTNIDYTSTTTVQEKYKNIYTLNGVSNVDINTGNGNNNIALTSDVKGSSNIAINLGNAPTGNNIYIRNGYVTEDPTVYTDTVQQSTKLTTTTWDNAQTHTSPLVVDYNKDGKIDATAAMGVDIDNNGAADGAATGGDKMLAMSDFSGNGAIDGKEVFGDQTVSPFTGERINAANGFEALKVIAEQAKQYTGIDCLKNGSVDLQALKTALATKGVNLGFISGNNVTELEDLGHVAAINVDNYAEVDATGDVQHRQLGSYTDTDGSTQKTDDVWFTAQPTANKDNFFEILKKLG